MDLASRRFTKDCWFNAGAGSKQKCRHQYDDPLHGPLLWLYGPGFYHSPVIKSLIAICLREMAGPAPA